jgi:hypothetical protein
METLTKKKNELLLPENTDTVIYDFVEVQQIVSPEETIENQIAANVEVTLLEKNHYGFLYNIEIHKRYQSNTEGMLGLDEALAFLQKKIVLYTNIHGEIISIVNRGQIAEDWYDQAKIIKKEFKYLIPKMDDFLDGVSTLIDDSDLFVNFVEESEVFSLLFPPVYNYHLMKEVSIEQNKSFGNFFDTTSLPLTVQTTVTGINKNTKGKQLMRFGQLDTFKFNKESASKLFTQSYGIHESALSFEVSYLESFDLDKEDMVDKASAMLGVKVNNLYHLKQISKLKKKK